MTQTELTRAQTNKSDFLLKSLRPYQEECLEAIWDSKYRRMLVGLPTGTGKTFIFVHLPGMYYGKRFLILSHREELMGQVASALQDLCSWAKVEIEQGNSFASLDADIVIASVPTLGRCKIEEHEQEYDHRELIKGTGQYVLEENVWVWVNSKYEHEKRTRIIKEKVPSDRLTRFPRDHFDFIVTDEAHHSAAEGYLRPLKWFNCYIEDKKEMENLPANWNLKESGLPIHVGFTATPFRADSKVILDEYNIEAGVFDELVFDMKIDQFIPEFLCDIRPYRIATTTDLDSVQVVKGDFVKKELQDAVNTAERNNIIIDSYKRLALGKKTIVFCVDIEHSIFVSEMFNEAGINAENISGMNFEERKDILAKWREKDSGLDVICNCNILTEGYDLPEIECVIMSRPTLSPIMYMQQMGRGLRTAENKESLKLIDLVDNGRKNPTVSINKIFDLPYWFNTEGYKVTEIVNDIERLKLYDPYCKDRINSMTHIQTLLNKYEGLKPKSLQELGIKHELSWVTISNQWVIKLFGKESIIIKRDDKSMSWKGYAVIEKRINWKQSSVIVESVTEGKEIQPVFDVMEDWLKFNRVSQFETCKRNAKWRMKPGSEVQKAVILKHMDIDLTSATQGYCSDIITGIVFKFPSVA